MNAGEIFNSLKQVSQTQAAQTLLVEITHGVSSGETARRDQQCCLTPSQLSPSPFSRCTELQKLLDTVCPLICASHVERGPVLQVFLVNVNLMGQKDLHALPVTCEERKSRHWSAAEQNTRRYNQRGTRAGNTPSLFIRTSTDKFCFEKYFNIDRRCIPFLVIDSFTHSLNVTSLDRFVNGRSKVVPELRLGSEFEQHVDTGHAATAAGIEQRSDPIDGNCVDLEQQDMLRIIRLKRNALAACLMCTPEMHQKKMLVLLNFGINFVDNFQSYMLWHNIYNILLWGLPSFPNR